jgi:predicted P-loop ATPase
MTEPVPAVNLTLLRDVETFKATVLNLDETGFKKEVAKLAAVQPQNHDLRDAVARIAADAFGDVGKQTVLQYWEGMQTVTSDANTQVALVRASGLLGFQHSKSPTGIAQSLENALIALDQLRYDCRYDLFHDKIVVVGYDSGLKRGNALEHLDNIGLKVRQTILMKFGFDPGPNYTLDALKMRAFDHMFDPVRDYLDSLRWDGVPRLGTWIVDYCDAPDTELNRTIGRKMLIAAVHRARNPGCKFDYIIVLEADQGTGKSTLLKILAGEDNFSDAEILGHEKREQQEAVQGVWIYEIGELEGLNKSEVTKVKLFASKTVDSARPAYGRHREDRPRRCIFVATTNDDKYLRDTTGNRRFWPVKVPSIDLTALARDRDQLWAEAANSEASGEALVIPENLWPDVATQQLARMEIDPWEEVLAAWLAGREDKKFGIDGGISRSAEEWRVSTSYLLSDVLNIPIERQYHNQTKRIAAIMRNLGWTRYETPMRIGSIICRGFVKPLSPSMSQVSKPMSHLSPPETVRLSFSRRVFGNQKVCEDQKTDEKFVTGVTVTYRRF